MVLFEAEGKAPLMVQGHDACPQLEQGISDFISLSPARPSALVGSGALLPVGQHSIYSMCAIVSVCTQGAVYVLPPVETWRLQALQMQPQCVPGSLLAAGMRIPLRVLAPLPLPGPSSRWVLLALDPRSWTLHILDPEPIPKLKRGQKV